jgi:hypothetical protein
VTVITLRKRLERIEASRHQGDPVRIMTNRPLQDGEAADALANWRDWVANGRANVAGNVLWIMDPPLTVAEWVVRFTAPNRRLH